VAAEQPPLSREQVPAPPGDDTAAEVDALEDRVMAESTVQPDEHDGGEDDGPVEGVVAHDEDVQTAPGS
jgi:hypothetical protein